MYTLTKKIRFFATLLVLLPIAAFADSIVHVTDIDIKKPSPRYVETYREVFPKLDLSKPEDRESLAILEREMYCEAMTAAGEPFFKRTKFKRSEDWLTLWQSRKSAALKEVKNERERESLRLVFQRLAEFSGPEEVTVLECVLKAKFGGEPIWIILVHCDGKGTFLRRLAGGEATMDHDIVVAYRVSDLKLISRFLCD